MLIDQSFCEEMLRVGNFFVSVSIEGFEQANDGRRGEGHFEKALAAMDFMHKNRIPFGVSICYTSRNYKVVTSDEFLDLLILLCGNMHRTVIMVCKASGDHGCVALICFDPLFPARHRHTCRCKDHALHIVCR